MIPNDQTEQHTQLLEIEAEEQKLSTYEWFIFLSIYLGLIFILANAALSSIILLDPEFSRLSPLGAVMHLLPMHLLL